MVVYGFYAHTYEDKKGSAQPEALNFRLLPLATYTTKSPNQRGNKYDPLFKKDSRQFAAFWEVLLWEGGWESQV